MEHLCGVCRFYLHTDPDINVGECRRYAPRAALCNEESEAFVAYWPLVASEDGCGDYELKL